jgi:hypothetical protein
MGRRVACEMPGGRRPMGPRHSMSYIQLSKIRSAANGKVKTSRGRKSPAQEYMGVSPQEAYSDEAIAPKSIIQEGEKGIRSLTIVFMEIQPVTDFFGETMTRRNRRVSRCNCRNKVTGKMEVRAVSRPIPAEKRVSTTELRPGSQRRPHAERIVFHAHCSLAYSALTRGSIGISGSASFQRARNSW